MKGGIVYSPKISEELIPKIYRIAKNRGMRMTTFVNEILNEAISKIEMSEVTSSDCCVKESNKDQQLSKQSYS